MTSPTIDAPVRGGRSDTLESGRVTLRRWRQSDRQAFAAINADPLVMQHFPSVLTREESDAFAERIEAHFARFGFGLWALEISGLSEFAGFVGLAVPRFQAHFTPCVEVGWRLARERWGHGYASAAAYAALRHGFEQLNLAEIVSFTVPANTRSQRVMARLSMTHDPRDDFEHPAFPPGHRLRRHVLYRMTRARFSDVCLRPGAECPPSGIDT